MIVVAIIGILAAIALPSYSDYVLRGRLPEGGLDTMLWRGMRKRLHMNRGFTLVELLTVIAIVAIAAAIASPSMASFIRGNRVTAEINALSSAIRNAKTEAIKRGGNVQVCASSNGDTCTGSFDWSKGWLVFDDKDKSKSLDSGETVLYQEQLTAGDTITASSSADQININADGFAVNLPGSSHSLMFTLSTNPRDDSAQRCLYIDVMANSSTCKKGMECNVKKAVTSPTCASGDSCCV
ncbi:GspH/FimT family pseudopilin [Comamonas odontotermitis]|uniref:GspH/FimT family pseudopilin n=1 Tax=Comamonas odontotermitis TaxID=379895 RepID=UPI00366E20A9